MAKKRTAGTDVPPDTLLADLDTLFSKSGLEVQDLDDNIIEAAPGDYVSSGSSLLDLAVSNREYGGVICYGRIMELNGLEGSGKSLIAAHMIKDVQDEGGVAILFDSEYALDQQNRDFTKSVGVKFENLKVVQTTCLEDVFETIENIILTIRKTNKDRKVLIIIDSLTALRTRKDLEGGFGKQGFGMEKPKYLSDAFSTIQRLIAEQKVALVFTQQLRQKMNVMSFADPWTTSGGQAPRFYASVRIRLAEKGKITIKVKDAKGGEDKVVVGKTVIANILKNRLGPPHRKVELDIYFDRGIDDVSSWLEYLRKYGIITGTNGRFTYIDTDTGEECKFTTGTWKTWTKENPEIFSKIYKKLADSMVTTYNTEGVNTLDGSADIDTDFED